MTNFKSTKKALLVSTIALLLCFVMLLGTTFAWFTDSVTSTGNVIKSGKLDIAFEKWDGSAWVNAENTAIFNYDLWEPGYTQIVNLRVVNKGTLALKWQAVISTEKSLSALADVINVYVASDDQTDSVRDLIAGVDRYGFDAATAEGKFKKFTLRQFINNLTVMTQGTMVPGQESYLGIVLQMDPEAGNEYQQLDLGGKFDLTILATQWTYENDSFGSTYDEAAPFVGSTVHQITGASGEEVNVLNTKGEKIASIVIPGEAIADGATETVVNVTESDYIPNITVAAGATKQTVNISVSNLKEGNTEEVKVQLYVGQGMDPATVLVYHYSDLIPSSYNPYTGYVTFETANFSPFTFVYDEASVYVPPVADESGVPVATVVAQPAYVGVTLPWGSYGKWSPNPSIENPTMEAVYMFTAAQTLDEAIASPYANWECDFFLSIDGALGVDELFLGGNYGSFGWVGFHNGDVTTAGGEEIALLGSVTNNAWTYLDVVQNVGTFICGVGDVNNALTGKTFTVTLRLTNPETSQSIDIVKIQHTFVAN